MVGVRNSLCSERRRKRIRFARGYIGIVEPVHQHGWREALLDMVERAILAKPSQIARKRVASYFLEPLPLLTAVQVEA